MTRNCRFPHLETYGSQPGNQRGTIARNYRFPEIRIYVFEAKQLSLQGIADSQSLKLMVPNLKTDTLPVEGSVDSKKIKIMVVLFCLLTR